MSLTTDLPVFTKADVAKHNTPSDAWATCNGYVLDLTKFLESHPGGPEVIEATLGKDIKQEMVNTDHSPYAFTLMKDYIIGAVQGEKPHEEFPIPAKQMRGYDVAEIRTCVDFDKAVLPQIFGLGDKYWPWIINRPVVHKMTMFPSDLMEGFSRWPWWYIWVLWPPVVLFNLIRAYQEGFTPSVILMVFFFGLVLWSLCEYSLHRFVFHYEVSSTMGNVFHYFMHGVHHLTPADSSRLTFPPPFAVAIGFITWGAICTVFSEAVCRNALFGGFSCGYLLYDTAHYYFHHSDFNNRLFRFCKTAHLGHHYKNEDRNFGVTSPLWDMVFGSYDASNTSTSPAVKDD